MIAAKPFSQAISGAKGFPPMALTISDLRIATAVFYPAGAAAVRLLPRLHPRPGYTPCTDPLAWMQCYAHAAFGQPHSQRAAAGTRTAFDIVVAILSDIPLRTS
jgi:hypothetical protein